MPFQLGTPSQSLRVAIVGAGPAGFYAADALLNQQDLSVQIDIFDKLPAPYGLVRYGVAPDHQKIKAVTKVFGHQGCVKLHIQCENTANIAKLSYKASVKYTSTSYRSAGSQRKSIDPS